MGARSIMEARLAYVMPEGVEYEYIGRPLRASPSEGYPAAHLAQQSWIVRRALEVPDPPRKEPSGGVAETSTTDPGE